VENLGAIERIGKGAVWDLGTGGRVKVERVGKERSV